MSDRHDGRDGRDETTTAVHEDVRATPAQPGADDSQSVADRLQRAACDVFGWEELRPGQLEAMEHVVAGRDAVVVLPTGAGKSATYQVPSALLDGPTLVVSPLVSLQHDQLLSLTDRLRAAVVNSSVGDKRSAAALQAWRDGELDVLFLAPEQLAKDELLEVVAEATPSLVVVDEAHCVSSWGHDFRPDYLVLGQVVDRLRPAAVLALTATAAPPVRAEIAEQLHMQDPVEVVRGFDRPGLELLVERYEDERSRRDAVIARAAGEAKPGIVYAATRKGAEAYAEDLAELGLDVAAYHAGMRGKDRESVHERFLAGELDVVVATTAFGMGIDKADVRFVLHAELPDSLDSYYQGIGRAGRDGAPARAVLHHREADTGLRRFFAASSVDELELQRIATLVTHAGAPVTPSQLADELGLSHTRTSRAVHLLEEVGGLVMTPREGLTPGRLAPPEAAAAAVERAHARQALESSRVTMARGYAEGQGCRRRYLLSYFGEQLQGRCSGCDVCARGTAEPVAQVDGPYAVQSRVHHGAWGEGVVMSVEQDRVTVLFEEVGYRTLSLAAVEAGGLLDAAA